jgi:hypothetical protein
LRALFYATEIAARKSFIDSIAMRLGIPEVPVISQGKAGDNRN